MPLTRFPPMNCRGASRPKYPNNVSPQFAGLRNCNRPERLWLSFNHSKDQAQRQTYEENMKIIFNSIRTRLVAFGLVGAALAAGVFELTETLPGNAKAADLNLSSGETSSHGTAC